MEFELSLVFLTIAVALIFDFINGFHDAANSIATIVSTRVLKPQTAVIWAAFFNFIAFLVFHNTVASTIGKSVVNPTVIDTYVILSALLGAISWNLLTWYFGLPSSSSHALIGALCGAAFVKAGINGLLFAGLGKIIAYMFLAPLLGFAFGWVLMKFLYVICKPLKLWPVNLAFRRLQLVSAALYSLGHGGNDAQKTMGVIVALLISLEPASAYKSVDFVVPLWVVLSCHLAMGLGTLCGGWRIVETMGMKITKLKPIGGFAAESSGGLSLFIANYLGIPVSTTHTITGSIMGVGAVAKISGVKWQIAKKILGAWILTIPASATVSGFIYLMLE
jgi:inorganic phosphate transporter, PiT family